MEELRRNNQVLIEEENRKNMELMNLNHTRNEVQR